MEKEIILERIDVDIAAKNFAKMLDEKKENFFLMVVGDLVKQNF